MCRSETYNGCGVHWREPFQNILAKQKWMQKSQCENIQVRKCGPSRVLFFYAIKIFSSQD